MPEKTISIIFQMHHYFGIIFGLPQVRKWGGKIISSSKKVVEFYFQSKKIVILKECQSN